MIPSLNKDGYLPPGIYWATWDEVCDRFADNLHRQKLLAGLRAALENLKAAGCETVYLDGSFVTGKEIPADFDGCWETAGVDPVTLDPVLLDLSPGRPTQKAKYLGELFPASWGSGSTGPTFLEFFQSDQDGNPKGIIALDLRRLR
jgi:hypothetical protein